MRIIIVGAGPAGAALACLLARRGIEVVLIERETGFERTFRGEALMPGGIEAIRQMGLGDAFSTLPQRVVECMELHVEGTRIFRAEGPEFSGPNAVHVVSQPALLGMLVSEAARSSGFELRMGTAVVGLEADRDAVRVRVRHNGHEETISADFVIGADGRGSIVRARAGLTLTRHAFPFDVAWFSTPMSGSQQADPRFQAFVRNGNTVVIYPSWNDSLRVGLNIPPGMGDGTPDRSELLEEIASITGENTGAFFREQADSIADPVRLKVLFGRCRNWSAPRVLILGDAAHPMSPVRAQGINLAIRDAVIAANHLVKAAEGGIESLQSAAEAIQLEREPEILASQRLQLAGSRPPPPARSRFLRSTLLPILRRTGVMRRQFLKAEVPLRHGTCKVELSV